MLVITRLSAEPPARLLRIDEVPSGPISVTTRSPRNVWVMLSDIETVPTLPPVTATVCVMPVALLSGIDFGRPTVFENVPATQPGGGGGVAPQVGSAAWAGTLTASHAAL